MNKIRVAVIGAGAFGRNHLRVLRTLDDVTLAAVVDSNPGRAAAAAEEFGCGATTSIDALTEGIDAAVVAVPTSLHAEIGCALLERGIDILVEKPIAPDLAAAQSLVLAAERNRRILQVGHLERFNPAVEEVCKALTLPLFFEIHRMSVFTPRSLDVDVVLDLMIHDVDILLTMTGQMPVEIRAAGIRILSEKPDIANVRLLFENGCVANLTASRVSTEKIRKLRLFQPNQYLSLDYQKQEVVRFTVVEDPEPNEVRMSLPGGIEKSISFDNMKIQKQEPLRKELEGFLHAVRKRTPPTVTATDATRALAVCLSILDKIEEHGRQVADTIGAYEATVHPAVTS
jgi:predicted dehydrogenase